jgi:PhnB protein
MMAKITAYLGFTGNCREAMNFYQTCLGGKLQIMTFGESPMAAQTPSELMDQVMHSALTNGQLELYGSDMPTPEDVRQGTNITLTINCDSREEIERYYANLSAGGQIRDELQDAFWGAVYAMLTDKYGVQWMLNYDTGQPA